MITRKRMNTTICKRSLNMMINMKVGMRGIPLQTTPNNEEEEL